MHVGMWSSIADLYPLGASRITLPIKAITMSPGVAKCLMGCKKEPLCSPEFPVLPPQGQTETRQGRRPFHSSLVGPGRREGFVGGPGSTVLNGGRACQQAD